ncbi:hypothetical protein PII47_06215 [Pseudomonas sp. 21TX0197]|uniref:hypothetical protein n=1 Tax=unclassified Pseudomonas TaxID=196821 RepID=UPI00091591C7|nr:MULTISPECIES: hypothetical protein [unclassified Pseudomonas]MDB6442971.1 hypothetical protein [Pseudomonas sp. 21TX0197]ROO38327.1 hypothetical protein BIV09_14985 [Pseudomonas sp. 7SR1]SFX50692.1 hypothetical protein SAMN03159390_01609 [Pseudomonas sp. NFACC49-2]SIR90939.1 hypothetical protein SAMN05428955_0468 [Pseudomonas sp. 7SR1]
MTFVSTLRQYSIKGWAAVVAIVGLMAGIPSISSWLAEIRADYYKSHFIGRWTEAFSYPNGDGVQFEFKGMIEYFPNSLYNINGVVALVGTEPSKPYRFEYSVNGAGNWSADSDYLSFTLGQMKTMPKAYTIDGKAISPLMVAHVVGPSMPNLSDIYPAGASGQARIKEVEKNRIVLEQAGPDGRPFIIDTHRQISP